MNRIKNLRWLYLAAVLIVGGQVHSQAVISFSRGFHLPSSIAANTTYHDTLYIVNSSTNDTFSGTVTIVMKVNNNPPFSYDSGTTAGISFSNNTASDIFTILPNDSFPAPVTEYYDTTEFSAAGPSVVVIWPALGNDPVPGNGIVGDSLEDTMQILYPAAITSPLPAGLKAYTDNEQLFIKCDEANALKLVRIFDVSGALILEQHLSASNTIPMGKFSDGVYLAQLTLTSGQQITYKIFSGR
jgi:hypothetical protein